MRDWLNCSLLVALCLNNRILKHNYEVLNVLIQKIRHYICQTVVPTMQKKFMNTPNTFPVIKENTYPICGTIIYL